MVREIEYVTLHTTVFELCWDTGKSWQEKLADWKLLLHPSDGNGT